jgi:hypothetical protein
MRTTPVGTARTSCTSHLPLITRRSRVRIPPPLSEKRLHSRRFLVKDREAEDNFVPRFCPERRSATAQTASAPGRWCVGTSTRAKPSPSSDGTTTHPARAARRPNARPRQRGWDRRSLDRRSLSCPWRANAAVAKCLNSRRSPGSRWIGRTVGVSRRFHTCACSGGPWTLAAGGRWVGGNGVLDPCLMGRCG